MRTLFPMPKNSGVEKRSAPSPLRSQKGLLRRCDAPSTKDCTHSRRAPGKGTPPHRPWGGVGAWGPPAQGEVRMVPLPPTATNVPFP
jgi:hypothetical protein